MSAVRYNMICKFLSVIAVSSVIAEVLYLLFGYTAFLMWPILLLLCGIGYAMQAIYGKITGHRVGLREGYTDETGYEGADNAFKPLYAAGPLTVAAIASLLLYKPFDALFLAITKMIPGMIYSENSLFPIIMVIAAFIGFGSGIVLWFFPAHRIISMRTMLAFLPVMFAVFLLAIFSGRQTGPMAVFLIVFALCSMNVLNQIHIQRKVNDTLTAINKRGRVYNFKLILFVMLIAVVVVTVVLAIDVGVSKIFGFLSILAIVTTLNDRAEQSGDLSQYDNAQNASSELDNIFGKGAPFGEKLLFILSILLFIGGIIFYITRASNVTKRFIMRVKEWFRELFLFFMDAWHYNGAGDEDSGYGLQNYKDEEIKLQNADINEYGRKAQPNAYSYRDFLSKLNSFETTTERIRFAYVTMMSVYRSRGMGNRVTETPRETRKRILSRTNETAIKSATDAIETVDYIEKELPEDEGKRAILDMCGVIEKHYNS